MKILLLITLLSSVHVLHSQETIKTYFDDAQKQLKSEHAITKQLNGKMYHGDFKEYYDNGKVKSSGEYTLGQLHGEYSQFNSEEKIAIKCRYTNGILNGEYKTYYPSGNIQERKLYINGKLQGDRKFYLDTKNAEPIKIEKYQMGKKL